METARGPQDDAHGAVTDTQLSVGGDERRMHVRAYNYWVSLLKGRPYPSIEDLDPGNIADFGPHSVLIDFGAGVDDPAIRFLGRALREECGVEAGISRVADVPGRSLLSRLTDHYLQIIANRAPIGFEAEFIGQRGHNTLYRGILMPFSSNSDTIDFIYGVINWKEMVDDVTQARLAAEIEAARRNVPPPAAAIWADGPSAGLPPAEVPVEAVVIDTDAVTLPEGSALVERLARARESAAAAKAADTRSRAALYRALSRAYDFALAAQDDAEGYASLLEAAELKPQARAPMTPAVKLVFGAHHDKTRIAEFAAVLAHAHRLKVAAKDFDSFLTGFVGGIKGVVQAERAQRRPSPTRDSYARATAALRTRAPLGRVTVDAEGEEFVLLLARAADNGTVEVVARVDAPDLAEKAIRKTAVAPE